MLALAPWQWALAAVCAVFVGTAKTGVPGLGIMAVPMMVLVVGQSQLATGTLLPLLCAADLFAVWYYRRHANAWTLWRLFPWVLAGGLGGWLVMNCMDGKRWDTEFRFLIGAIVIAMVVLQVAKKRVSDSVITPNPWRAAVFGLVAGFATTTANAAGPVMNVYLLSMALPKDQFMGTGAWYFLVVNLAKIPGYLLLKEPIITGATLALDACVLPGIVAGALWGRWIYDRLPQRAFEVVVLALTALGGFMLLLPMLKGLLQPQAG
jgi:uncharacterized membrane protein YfcA